MNSENYGIIAKYYDGAYSAKAGVNLQDVRFYLEQAQQHCGPILEIACGTGRFAHSSICIPSMIRLALCTVPKPICNQTVC